MKKTYFHLPQFYFFLFITIIGMNSCRPSPTNDVVVGESKEDFDEADQIMIGKAIDDKIENGNNGYHVLDKDQYQELYVHLNTMIDQITNTAYVDRREDFDWRVSVFNSEEQNAFMTPGGHLYISSGLLRYMEGEHELVGVIAHEVAYADSDLLINRLKSEFSSKTLSKILSNDRGSDGLAAEMARGIRYIEYTEKDVMIADQFSTDIVCEFIWDGEGLLSLLKRGDQNGKPIQWLTLKPTSEHRTTNLNHLIFDRLEACGTTDSIFHQRYVDKILSNLPE